MCNLRKYSDKVKRLKQGMMQLSKAVIRYRMTSRKSIIETTNTRKEVFYLINKVFDEVAEQFYYLKSNDVLTDIRFCSYISLASKVLALLNQWYTDSKSNPQEILDQLHFEVWEDKLLGRIPAYQIHDSKCILMGIEVLLFGNTVIYEKYWEDRLILQREYEGIDNHLANIPMQKGAIWEIKGKKYAVGAPFTMCSDLWLRPLEDSNRVLHYSYRLSEFLPLSTENCRLFCVGLDQTTDSK